MPSFSRRTFSAVWLVLAWVTAGCASTHATPPPASAAPAPEGGEVGVIVMAHGGPPEWNAGVLETVAPLRKQYPLEVAFGMADAISLQESVRKLEARGIRKIAVVRLFVSGESWFERTQQILGLRSGAPAQDASGSAAQHGHHGLHGHSMAFFRIQTDAAFAMHPDGLADAAGMGTVLADRALARSQTPEREDVLILAHGPGDDAENERWLTKLDQRAAVVRQRAPFRRVQVATLREDWPDKRVAAEREIRAFVERATNEGGKAIVIPFRVFGFGPYADVLSGLQYVSDGKGLIPHDEVGRWLEQRAASLAAARFEPQVPR